MQCLSILLPHLVRRIALQLLCILDRNHSRYCAINVGLGNGIVLPFLLQITICCLGPLAPRVAQQES